MPAKQIHEDIEINYLSRNISERTEYLNSIFKLNNTKKCIVGLNIAKWNSLNTGLQITIVFDLTSVYKEVKSLKDIGNFLIITILNKLYTSQRVVEKSDIENRKVLFDYLTAMPARLIEIKSEFKSFDNNQDTYDLHESLDSSVARNLIFHSPELLGLATYYLNPKFIVDILDLRWKFSIESPKLAEKIKESIETALKNDQVEKIFVADFIKNILDYLKPSYFSSFDAKLYADIVAILQKHLQEDEALLCFINRADYGIRFPGEESCSLLRSFKRKTVGFFSQKSENLEHANDQKDGPGTPKNKAE